MIEILWSIFLGLLLTVGIILMAMVATLLLAALIGGLYQLMCMFAPADKSKL